SMTPYEPWENHTIYLAFIPYGNHEHITSLKPLNPANKADPWERSALESFEKGAREAKEIITVEDGARFLRLMLPLMMEKGCLDCHEQQGNKLGDVRGGISVHMSMTPYEPWENHTIYLAFISHTIFWLLGILLLVDMVKRDLYRNIEREKQEKLLKKSEYRYHQLMNFAGDAIMVADVETGLIEEANQIAGDLLGLPVEKIVGMHQRELHPDTETGEASHKFQRAVASENKITEYFVLNRQKGIIPVEINSRVIDLGDRKIIQGIFRDVSEQKKREQLLMDRKAHLSATLNNALDAIITIDAQGRIVEFNPAAEALFGWTRQEAVGNPMAPMLIPPEFRQRHLAALAGMAGRDLAKHPLQRHMEVVGLRKDGQQVDLEFNIISTIRDGKPCFTAFAHDVTDRKQLLRSLQDTLTVAESANQAKSAFLANMSHEIRTPMNAIIGMTDLVLTMPMSAEEQRQHLEIVQQSSTTLLTLINSILDLSKIESGKFTLENIPFDMCEQVEGVCERVAGQAHRKGLELCCHVADDVPTGLRGDPLRLQQIITNLVNNSTKFTEEGEIVVRVETLSRSRESDAVRLHVTVADTGIGIPKDKLSAVFEHFTQVDNSITRRYGGSGLGLTISKHLVQMMGGEIWIESEPGKGTLFHFTAQFGIDRDKAPVPPDAYRKLVGTNVLIGEVSRTKGVVQQKLVTSFGAVAEVVTDGPSLLASLQQAQTAQRPFDLLLLDHRLLDEAPPDPDQMATSPGWLGKCVVLLPTQVSMNTLAHLPWLKHAIPVKKPPPKTKLLQAMCLALGKECATQPASPTRLSKNPRHHTPSLHILLVEDQETNRMLADTILKRAGHQVTLANDGQEALTLLQQTPFDLVLMDLHMPHLDGLETTRRIRSASPEAMPNPRLPIVAVTARTSENDEKICLEAGMDGFLRKPYRTKDLLQAIEPFLQKRAAAPQPKPATRQSVILKPVETDPQTLAEAMEMFLQETPQRVDNLEKYLEKRDPVRAEKENKWLRTVAENIGAIRVLTHSMRLRGNVETADWEEARQTLQTLKKECQTACQAVREKND
ncbi:MAG: PAS domain S-box protein, partial [Magnetococcales bacterium]|nr:PAS domain S-box protein [Magnetococcales bacterium]